MKLAQHIDCNCYINLYIKRKIFIGLNLVQDEDASFCLWRCNQMMVLLREQDSERKWDYSGLNHVV